MNQKALRQALFDYLKPRLVAAFPVALNFDIDWTNSANCPLGEAFARMTFLDFDTGFVNRSAVNTSTRVMLEVHAPEDVYGYTDRVVSILESDPTLGGAVKTMTNIHGDYMEAVGGGALAELTFDIVAH